MKKINTGSASSSLPVFSEGLASLRGLAAAIVVVFHALLVFQVDGHNDPHKLLLNIDDGWLTAQHMLIAIFNGHAAVVLFFVLSGTVLTLSLARVKHLKGQEIIAFYIRRALRLIPLLIAVTLASAWAHHFYFEDVEFASATNWMNRYYKSDPGLTEILHNAAGWSSSLNSPAWTIRIEIAASVAFPVLYWVSNGTWPVVITVGLVLLTMMFAPGLSIGHLETFLFAFYLGALIPRWSGAPAQAFLHLGTPARLAIICMVLIVMAGTERLYTPTTFSDPRSVLIVTLCAAVLVSVIYYNPRGGLLRRPSLVFLGEISYGLYLIHMLVLFMLAHAIAPSAASLDPSEAVALNIGLAIATLALTVPLATVAYYGFEKPCQRLGHGFGAIVGERIGAFITLRPKAKRVHP
ncbi:acyltransferase family protein [Microvirga roseola]|uniref:acyltransferase family protein n=1 Tax=Microvirga roseola TaxID=2883126 RepID=UPI001E64C996|nr:acyltransferase [Microvirga roseola]